MEWDRGRSGGRELIDFASRLPSRGLAFNARLSDGAVTLKTCTSAEHRAPISRGQDHRRHRHRHPDVSAQWDRGCQEAWHL